MRHQFYGFRWHTMLNEWYNMDAGSCSSSSSSPSSTLSSFSSVIIIIIVCARQLNETAPHPGNENALNSASRDVRSPLGDIGTRFFLEYEIGSAHVWQYFHEQQKRFILDTVYWNWCILTHSRIIKTHSISRSKYLQTWLRHQNNELLIEILYWSFNTFLTDSFQTCTST